MRECLIRNLCDSPRDYPLKDGSSIYLGCKGHSSGTRRLSLENISEAMRVAEHKDLLMIEEMPDEEVAE